MFNPKVGRILSHFLFQKISGQSSLIIIYLFHIMKENIQNTEFSLNVVTSFNMHYLIQYHKKSIGFYYWQYKYLQISIIFQAYNLFYPYRLQYLGIVSPMVMVH